MGHLKPDQKHRVVVEVHGKKLADITAYMKDLKRLLKKYQATIKQKRKMKARPARRKKPR
jgi:hypothetical protein